MKKIIATLLSLAMCIGLCTHIIALENNLVINGNYSQGTDYWEINKKDDTDAKMSAKNNQLDFEILKVNGNYWDLGLKQTNIKFTNGQHYKLTFQAKSTSLTSLHISVENQTNWNKHLDTTIQMNEEFQEYELDFSAIDSENAQLVFHAGEQKDKDQIYSFKDVSIKEVPVQKISSWTLNENSGTVGKLSGDEESIQVKVNQINQNWWDLTLKKDNIQLDNKKLYQVNFDIISTTDGTISFDIENTNDYTVKAIDRTMLQIKKRKQSFQYTFIKNNTNAETIAFHLSGGDGNSDMTDAVIQVQNLKFKELSDLGQEYVMNGNFDYQVNGWEVYNSNNSDLKISTEDNQGKLTFLTSQGQNWWDSQFFQRNIYLSSGEYEVGFDMKSTVESQIHFDIEDTNDYNKKYLEDRIINLHSEYQTFKYSFTIALDNILGSNNNVRLQYNVGKEGNNSLVGENIYIDNVYIKKVKDIVVNGEAKNTEVVFNTNDVITSDYKGLGVQWDPYQVHPLTDEEWNMVTQRVDYLNPSFVRCMIYSTTYCKGLDENKKPIYDFESSQMKELIKELDYLESRQIEVILGEWEAPDRFKGQFEGVTVDSPYWAEIIGGLIDYLINEKGYTCIQYYNYVNEANSSWSYCEDYNKWVTGIRYLHKKFDELGINDRVKIIGPDTVWDDDNTWLKNIEKDSSINQKIGLYDVHMYPTIDEITSGEIETKVRAQRQSVSGKDFYMTEIGMVTGKENGDSQSYIRDFSYGVVMADAAVQTMRGGFSGVAIWDLDDAMHDQQNGYDSSDIRSLKQWGFWNSTGGRLYNQKDEENIRPHFYTWSLMTHLFPRHCQIINSTSTQKLNGLRTVAMKTDDGQITYMIVNNSTSPMNVKVFDYDVKNVKQVYEYRYFDNDRIVDENDYPIEKNILKDINFEEGFDVNLPSGGVVFLSTIDTKTQVASKNEVEKDKENIKIEQTTQTHQNKPVDATKTGDHTSLEFMIALSIVGFLGICVFYRKRYEK